jgi:hypothetical protein
MTDRLFQFAPGDQVQHLITPPAYGIVIAKVPELPDVYLVRLAGTAFDVIIHARNLRKL